MKRANVSVVIPAYNCASYITQAVDSVLTQTVPPAEIIVVDDGSTDTTAARLQTYGGKIRYIGQDNMGVSAARNRGIEAATGDFIAFLDSDDIWHPRKLELQLQAFEQIPALGLVGTKMTFLPISEWPRIDPLPENLLSFVSWRRLVVKNYLATSSVMVRSSILNIAGGFDTEMHSPEDRDLWLRIAEISIVVNLNVPLIGYRVTPGSLSQQPDLCERGMMHMMRKLDARRAWKGRWLLRRKARSYMYHSCSYLYDAHGNQQAALSRELRSLLTYPLPYRPQELSDWLERPRRVVVVVMRKLGLKRPPVFRPADEGTGPGSIGNTQLSQHVSAP